MKEAKVEEITRLGTGNEPRLILLKLNDAQAQRKVLSKAKLLRNSRSEMHRNINLAPDKTIKERESTGHYKRNRERGVRHIL